MTEDEFRIQDTPGEALVKRIRKARECVEEERSKGTPDISTATTPLICLNQMEVCRDMVSDIFSTNLPGVSKEDQIKLYRRFIRLWKDRRIQLAASLLHMSENYEVRKKEGSE